MQFFCFFRIFRQNPGLVFVDIGIDFICQMHDLTQRLAEFACFIKFSDFGRSGTEIIQNRRVF